MPAFAMVVLLFASGATASVVTLTLSDYASDGINPPLAEDLDATLSFSVLATQLALTVVNLTPEIPADPALKINEIYFNVSDNVTDLVLLTINGQSPNAAKWDGLFDTDNIQVNGFGKFDVSLIDGVGQSPKPIQPGETFIFIFDISGTGPFYDDDFIEFSAMVEGNIIAYAAARFYNDGPETSAYGATDVIPEPATLLLLGLGGLALLRKRKT